MHRLPVKRSDLPPDERELLELCADGWSVPLIAAVLKVERPALRTQLWVLCTRLGLAPRPDGRPPVHAARMWLVETARRDRVLAA